MKANRSDTKPSAVSKFKGLAASKNPEGGENLLTRYRVTGPFTVSAGTGSNAP
jgi:hypothetical protein